MLLLLFMQLFIFLIMLLFCCCCCGCGCGCACGAGTPWAKRSDRSAGPGDNGYRLGMASGILSAHGGVICGSFGWTSGLVNFRVEIRKCIYLFIQISILYIYCRFICLHVSIMQYKTWYNLCCSQSRKPAMVNVTFVVESPYQPSLLDKWLSTNDLMSGFCGSQLMKQFQFITTRWDSFALRIRKAAHGKPGLWRVYESLLLLEWAQTT